LRIGVADPLLIIKDWAELYENNRSRTVTDLRWVMVPNRHDGDGYCQLMAHSDAAEIFSAWNLILQVASRCQPRGTLLQKSGLPHTAESLAVRTRGNVNWFKKAIPFLLNVQWLQAENADCQEGVSQLSGGCQPTDEERKKERIQVIEVIEHLNKAAKTKFRPLADSTRKFVSARLADGYTVEDCKRVIDRQVAAWLNDPKWAKYLRPETLFNATKFEGYVNGATIQQPKGTAIP